MLKVEDLKQKSKSLKKQWTVELFLVWHILFKITQMFIVIKVVKCINILNVNNVIV